MGFLLLKRVQLFRNSFSDGKENFLFQKRGEQVSSSGMDGRKHPRKKYTLTIEQPTCYGRN